MGVADKKQKGKGTEEEDLSLKHGERDSQEHEPQAPRALQMASASMPLVSPSQQLFHGRQDSECREIRLGLLSNGRMVDETLGLLKDCGLPVERDSPQQCIATIPQLPNLRVFFQHSEEIVRNLSSGHLDIGIVGFDTLSECRQDNDDLIIVHDALGYGHHHLSLTIGTADVILDLGSSGTTIEENNLKENEGGTVLESQAVFVASRKSLIQREDVLGATQEILERLEARLKAVGQIKLQAPKASDAVPMASKSMPLLPLPQQLLRRPRLPFVLPKPLLLPFSDMHSRVSGERLASSKISFSNRSLPSTVAVPGFKGGQDSQWREIRLGLPSNGPMVDETLGLLKDCGLPVEWDSPQQYVATIPQLPNSQVFFQHSEEIVRNLSSGHLDIGIVGFDIVSECQQGNNDLIIVHNDLGYGHCHLSLAIPENGIFERIISVKELAQMPQWTEENPLRVVTGLPNLGRKFMKENGLKHVSILTADGALEGFLQRGWADVILDLVSGGTKLRENNLKEIEGGTALETQTVLVASRKSLVQWEGVCDTTREILERLEAHLKADGQIMVTAYMSGSSVEEVAERVLSQPSLSGLQNPAICQVFCQRDGKMVVDCYAIDIYVPEKALHSSVQQLRNIGSSRVLISPSTSKWQQLLSKLEL